MSKDLQQFTLQSILCLSELSISEVGRDWRLVPNWLLVIIRDKESIMGGNGSNGQRVRLLSLNGKNAYHSFPLLCLTVTKIPPVVGPVGFRL
jgi:hypothetical protein